MSTFSDAVQDFFAAAAGFGQQDFAARVNAVFSASASAMPEELGWAAGPLVETLARATPERAPRISTLGLVGDLLCRGASLWGAVPFLLAGLRHHLRLAEEGERLMAPLLAGRKWKDLDPEQRQVLFQQLPEAAHAPARSWELVGYLLGPAMAIFDQVPRFRQLARAMNLDVEWLRQTQAEPDWLPHLPRILEERAASDGPLPDPSANLAAALAPLRQGSKNPLPSPSAFQAVVGPVFDATTFCPPEVFNAAAVELAHITAGSDLDWASQLAQVCGAFVERGADAEAGADALVAGLPRLLGPTVAFAQACRARGVAEGESPLEKHGEAVGAVMPEAQRALGALPGYCLGTIAHLARSPAARKRHGANRELIEQLDRVRWDVNNTGFLWKMLQVLDEEEVVILAPRGGALKEPLGWKVKIGGIGDNFQFHALIGGHLVGSPAEGKYPGLICTSDVANPRPGVPLSPRALATQTDAPCTGREPSFSSKIQLWNWTALQKDGSLPSNPILASSHFVWNEGIPADVERFEGTRVVLLGESSIQRGWNGGRIFPFLSASFEVVEALGSAGAGEWLGRIAGRG